MNLLLLLSFLAMFFTGFTKAGQSDEKYDARIDTKIEDGKMLINNVFVNKSQHGVDFTYKFKCSRKGLSGSSTNSQSGSFTAAPGETVTLSKTAVTYTSSDSYTLTLNIFDKKGTVVSDSYTSGSE